MGNVSCMPCQKRGKGLLKGVFKYGLIVSKQVFCASIGDGISHKVITFYAKFHEKINLTF